MGIRPRGGGGLIDEAPVVTELKVVGEPTQSSIDISYKVTDAELQIVRHYIAVNDVPAYQKKEITKDVGYESETGVFTYTIAGLEKGTTYTIQIMCDDGLLQGNSNALQAKTKSQLIYTFVINEADSNPATRVSYEDDAVGISPATPTSLGGWEDKWPFNVIRIVSLDKGGKNLKEIRKEDRTKYLDGTSVPAFRPGVPLNIDVFTEFPTIYWRKTAPSGKIKVEISDSPLVGGDCYAHKVGGAIRPTIYVGCYLAGIVGVSGSELASFSGESGIGVNKNLTTFRSYAHNKGSGYELLNFNILTMLQNLWTLAYRNTNSQLALGKGYTEGTRKVATGGTDTKGWVYGSQNGKEQMCFLGIEDLWGNLNQIIDGAITDSNTNILINFTNSNFNDEGAGYENVGRFESIDGYITKIMPSEKTGFIPVYTGGSTSTYYPDYVGRPGSNCVVRTNGKWNDGANAGIFNIKCSMSISGSSTDCGARLVYIGEVN